MLRTFGYMMRSLATSNLLYSSTAAWRTAGSLDIYLALSKYTIQTVLQTSSYLQYILEQY